MEDKITGMYELLDSLEAVIKSAPEAARHSLKETIDAYSEDFPDDYFWAIGPQSPMMLNQMLCAIDSAASNNDEPKSGRVIRLVDRKPQGNA